MSRNLDSVHIEPSSYEVLHATFASLWRRKLPIMAIVAIALTLGVIALLMIPKRYTAEAYIRGGFPASSAVATSEDKRSTAPSISLDLERVIETQSNHLKSYQLAHRVVERLGLERLQPEIDRRLWLASPYGNFDDTPGHQEDLAATELSSGLSVTSDPRAYLIVITYTSEDAALAALITDTFVAELLRSTTLQSLYQQRWSAQATLSEQLATFGDKHPKVIEARKRLSALNGFFEEEQSKPSEEILQAAGENVTRATVVLSGPKPKLVIGLCLVLGLMVGIGVALWLERVSWWETVFKYYARSSVPSSPLHSPEAQAQLRTSLGFHQTQPAGRTTVAEPISPQGGAGQSVGASASQAELSRI